jgi:acyl-CoA dehydrogenase
VGQRADDENKRGAALLKRISAQKEKTRELLRQYGLQDRDVLQLNRVSGGQSKL